MEKEEIILDFLRWASTNDVRLARHGRPPYGKEGIWYFPEEDLPALTSQYLLERGFDDGVQRPEV